MGLAGGVMVVIVNPWMGVCLLDVAVFFLDLLL